MAGTTYTIELYDVSSNLNVTFGRGANSCNPIVNYSGLAIQVFNVLAAPASIAAQCPPNPSATAYSYLTFTAANSGMHYIRISLNAIFSNDSGVYSVRIVQGL